MPSVRISRRRLSVMGLAVAAAAAGSRTARAAGDAAVIAPIQGLCDALVTVMKAGTARTPFGQRFEMLAPAVDRALDLGTILQVSVGTIWNTLSPDQHAALMDAFRRYTINSYVNSFDSFNGQRFVVDPNTRAVGANQVVSTKIVPVSGESHSLDYVMRQSGADWKAVDVLAEGSISRVATQRSDFRALVMRGGSDALVASLTQKANDLANKKG